MNSIFKYIFELFKKVNVFLNNWRAFSCTRLTQYVLMFSSVPMLLYGIKSYNYQIMLVIVYTIIALFSGFFATLLWNDISDIDIDKLVHPNRPLPSKRISSKKMFLIALFFSAMTFIFSFLVSFWCLIIVGMTAIFVAIHNKYLRKTVKFPAYSEIFTPIQWVIVPIFGFFAFWSAIQTSGDVQIFYPIFENLSFNWYDFQNMIILVVFTYFADNAHDLPEGIHDIEGDRKAGIRTYATSFGEKNAARISFIMFFISGIFGIIIYIRTILSPLFLILFLLLWIYTLNQSFSLLKVDKEKLKLKGKIVGQKTFRFFWISYDLIFLDIFIQIISKQFL